MQIINGEVGDCPICHTPWDANAPDGYSITVQGKRGRNSWPKVYMHTPDCPDRFPAVVIPDEQ